MLTVNFTLGTTVFVMTSAMIKLAEQNAWLIPLYSGLAGMVMALLVIGLHHLHPGKSLIQIPLEVLGPWAGRVVVLIYFLYFSLLLAWVLHNLSDFLKGTYMLETPPSVFHFMFLIVAAYTTIKGVTTIARVNQFVTPFLFFPFWLSVMLGIPAWEGERFRPFFHFDLGKVLLNSHPFIAFPFMEWLTLFLLYPYVQRKPGRALILGLGLAAVSLSIIITFLIALLGVERASRVNFPVYTFVQEVTMGNVITNIHAVISMVFIVMVYIKTLVLYYSVYTSLKELVQPASTWPITFGLLVFLGALARSIYLNQVQNMEFIDKYYFVFTSFFVIVIPTFLLAASWIRTRWGKKRGGQKVR